MTDTDESLKGTFEVHDDGSVSGVLKNAGTHFRESAERLLACGHASAATYAELLVSLGYRRRGVIGPFGSGAVLITDGEKIIGRVAPEPQRAPLPDSDAWRYTGKERDDFPGFTVTHEQVIDFILPANRPAPKGSTLHAHPGKGSALLRG